MKKLMAVALISAMVLTTVTACGNQNAEISDSEAEAVVAQESSDLEDSDSSMETEDEDSDVAEDYEDSDSETAEQPVPTTKEINETIVDSELGYTITVKQAIIDVPFDDPNIWYNGYRTGVAVEVELKNDSEYTGGLYASDLKLVVDGTPVNSMSFCDTYASENGLEALTINGVQSGESASGWLFFYYTTGSGDNDLVLRYSRQETMITVIGGSEGGTSSTLPAQDFDISL